MGCLRLTTFLLGLALVSGCATSGPNHVYLTTVGGSAVHDLGPPPADIAGAVEPVERVLGLAYDSNTDHLFVRLARSIRVIERPSGKILREMPLSLDNPPAGEVVGANIGPAALPRSVPEDTAPVDKPRAPSRARPGAGNGATSDPADLAIRSSDRHLFAAHPDGRSVEELTLFGEFVRHLKLVNLDTRIHGLAYDQKNSRLLVLTATSPARIGHVSPDANVTYYITLAEGVRPASLGYDSESGHCFVPLADGTSLGEFDATDALVKTHRTEDRDAITAIDAGPRSLVRVF